MDEKAQATARALSDKLLNQVFPNMDPEWYSGSWEPTGSQASAKLRMALKSFYEDGITLNPLSDDEKHVEGPRISTKLLKLVDRAWNVDQHIDAIAPLGKKSLRYTMEITEYVTKAHAAISQVPAEKRTDLMSFYEDVIHKHYAEMILEDMKGVWSTPKTGDPELVTPPSIKSPEIELEARNILSSPFHSEIEKGAGAIGY